MPESTNIILEGAAALFAGAFGAVARLTATMDPAPLLTKPGFWFRSMGEMSLGFGGWLVAHAMGLDGFAAVACAWGAGVLGYVVIHDTLLRVFKRQFGGRG